MATPVLEVGIAMGTDSSFEIVSTPQGWWLGRFPALAARSIPHAVSMRSGPAFTANATDSATAAASRQLARALDLDDVAWCPQVHGNDVLAVSAGGLAGEADGLITATRGLGVLGRSADCPLVLVAGPARRMGRGAVDAARLRDRSARPWAVGMAHASWRSTVAGVTLRLMLSLSRSYGVEPAECAAVICPSAGPCCYEVGEEVEAAARKHFGGMADRYLHWTAGRLHFDLWQANADHLRLSGIRNENIDVAGICTLCRNDLFPSYRREGASAARFAAIIAAV